MLVGGLRIAGSGKKTYYHQVELVSLDPANKPVPECLKFPREMPAPGGGTAQTVAAGVVRSPGQGRHMSK